MASSKKYIFLYMYLLCFKWWVIASSDVGNANNYIDEVLKNLRDTPSVKAEFDPLKIPDFDEGNLKGSNGVVKGLSNLYRHGDCTISYEDKVATVEGEIGVRDVAVTMNYKAKALFFWIKGFVDASLEDLAVKIVLSVQDGKATLVTFKVVNMGKYKINKITGMSVVLNWLLKLIANSIAKKSKGKIIDALENGASSAINDVLKKVNIPL